MNGEPHGTFTGGYSKGSESMESGLWRTGKDEEKLCRSMNTNVSRVGR